MWIKNIRIFQFQSPVAYDPDKLSEMLTEAAFRPCPKSHAHSYGWTPPLGNEDSPLVFGQHGAMLIQLRIEEKVLPASVVREQLLNKIKELELQTGRRLYKDEKERLKDEIYQTLLTKAFTKSSYVSGYIDTHKNWLIVDCASSKKLAHFLSMLMKVIGTSVFAPECVSIPQVLTGWLSKSRYPGDFAVGSACLLKDLEERGSVVRIKNGDLFSDKVQAFLNEGSIATQITLEWRENVRFTLKEDFGLSQVKFLDAVKDLARDGLSETQEERFASDFMIMTQTVQKLMDDLLPHFLKEEKEEVLEGAAIAT